jgi:inner membrane protein
MTPVGHALAGYAVYTFSVAPTNPNRLKLAFLCIFMATAPDLDFLPGILMGRPQLYHHGITHSLGFAFVASLVIAGIVSIRMKPFILIFSLCLISYLSHLLIDFLGSSSHNWHSVVGIPLFWPISREKFSSTVGLYLAFRYNSSPSATIIEWIKSMLNLYNINAIALEVALLIPVIFLGEFYRRWLKRGQLT